MEKSKRIAVILLCAAVIVGLLLFAKADINHGHGLSHTQVTETHHL